MSIVGPLVNPNELETRFDRTAFLHLNRKWIVAAFVAMGLAAAAAIYTDAMPGSF
jgi:hypothetical protein